MSGVNMMPHGVLAAMTGMMFLSKSIVPAKTFTMLGDGMNKKFPDREVPHAWLTRDIEIRKQYEADPFCGHPTSLRFTHSMSKLMYQATADENLKKVPDDLPIAMFCGQEDPAGGYGSGAKLALNNYLRHGKKATLKMYPDARHEILNETNKEEIYQDILSFLESVVGD